MKRTKLLALLTSISCILLTIVLVGSYFTAAYAMMINKELGIVTTSVVTDDPSKNATYYASSFLKEDGTRDDDALTAWQRLCAADEQRRAADGKRTGRDRFRPRRS